MNAVMKKRIEGLRGTMGARCGDREGEEEIRSVEKHGGMAW